LLRVTQRVTVWDASRYPLRRCGSPCSAALTNGAAPAAARPSFGAVHFALYIQASTRRAL